MQTFRANILRAILQWVERRFSPERCGGRVLMKEGHLRPEAARSGCGDPSRWPAAIALLIVGTLYAVISGALTFGPRAFLLALVSVLLVPLLSAHQRGHHRLARWLGLGLVGLVTVAIVVSVFLLILSAFSRTTHASALLQDAALLWTINVFTFGVWYWEIDGGGPAWRHPEGHVSQDFLFPQMNLDGKTVLA